jgi:hypothetical protein
MMIPVKQFVSLERKARQALKNKDGAALDAINASAEAVAINLLLIARDGELYVFDRAIWLEEEGDLPCYAEAWKSC